MRRILIIIAAVIVLLGGATAIYFVFFASTPSISVAPTTNTTLPSAGGAPTSSGSSSAGGEQNNPVPVSTPASSRLVEINKGPVVPGVLASDTTASSSTAVRVSYLERQSGNVFSYQVDSAVNTRTSNRTVPGIERAWWSPDGSRAYVQYLSGVGSASINTYALPADGSSGFFLPKDLADIAISSTTIVTLASGNNGSIATIEKPDGSSGATAFSTPLSSLRIALGGKSLFTFTKPSGIIPGYAFIVDKGNLVRIEGPLTGLVALPGPLGKHVLVSYTDASALKLELIDLVAHTVTALPVGTIADKCTWAADESAVYCGVPVNPAADFLYPDDWYQGATSFSDRIWRIDVAGRYAALVLDFSAEAKTALDSESLSVDAAKKILVFVNKVDSSLWSYQL